MRALLVANPTATATTPRGRDVLIRALGSDLKIDVAETTHRGHAAELAGQAVVDELDLVVALGGDGTVNEVVNGLLATPTSGERPAVAVVPGGSANVFARGLGQPLDPIEATSALLEALRGGQRRQVSVGMAGDRFFTFCAGIGLDAEVVRIIEERRQTGARATPALYARAGVRHYLHGTDRHRARLTVQSSGEEPVDRLFMAIVSNTAPWTYYGTRPVNPCPDASFDTGLDLFALRRLRVASTVRTLAQMFSDHPAGPRGRHVVRRHDLAALTVRGSVPVPLQVDGDYIGELDEVVFRNVPRALTVIA